MPPARSSLASESARNLDLVFSDEIMRTNRIATNPLVVKALEERDDELQRQDRPALSAEIEAAAQRWGAGDAALKRAVTENRIANLLKQQVTRPDDNAGPIVPAARRG